MSPGVPARSSSGGSTARQSSATRGQRGANRQPTGISRRFGGRPSITVSTVCGGWSGRGIESSRAPVYGCAGSSSSARVSPTSRNRPAYMTPMRSVCCETTARSWLTRIIAMSESVCRPCSRSRISCCTVTSSAVVGSSAMSSLGSQDSAMAMPTRWRMPPESWCGYSFSRVLGDGMRTRVSISTARSTASLRLRPRWWRSGSMICRPIVRMGLSEVSGSWKTMAISRPQNFCASRRVSDSTSRPSKRTVEDGSTRAEDGAMPMIDRTSIDLPDPDSPTMPIVSPRRSEMSTPSTGVTRPAGVSMWVRRFRTSSSRSVVPGPRGGAAAMAASWCEYQL
ncbi:hypothetical protein BFG51_08405 [Dietzia alimentaria]|nr:hypothetical protein BFG51_08405 [Dietzia alimentaria]